MPSWFLATKVWFSSKHTCLFEILIPSEFQSEEWDQYQQQPLSCFNSLILIGSWQVGSPYLLTHWGRVTHICVSYLTIIGSAYGLAPSHYLNQCWNIVNWTLRNTLQWSFNRNSNIFIQENALQNVVCKMASILSRPQWVKSGLRETVAVNRRRYYILVQRSRPFATGMVDFYGFFKNQITSSLFWNTRIWYLEQ